MQLQLCKSLKLLLLLSPSSSCPRHLHPLFLTSLCRFRVPCTSLPICHTQSCPFISCLTSHLLQSLHTSAQPTSSLHLKLHLLRQERFLPSQVKLLQDNPYFLAASFERVSSLISFLRGKDKSGALARGVLTRSPSILQHKEESLEAKFRFFQDLGIGSLGLRRILTNRRAPALLSIAIETLQKPIDFLQRIGLSKTDLPRVVRRYPKVLCTNVDTKMEATLVYFEHHGLSKDDFLRLVKVYPHVFGYSVELCITKKLEFLRGLGLNFPSKRSARALVSWITFTPERLLSGLGFLKNQGFSEADIHKMVLRQPEVLTRSEDCIKCRIEYLKNVLNRDLQDVIKYPPYLCHSFENRIIPRFTFLNELKKSGQHTKELSLGYLLSPSDDTFERTHGTGYAQWKAKHQNKQ